MTAGQRDRLVELARQAVIDHDQHVSEDAPDGYELEIGQAALNAVLPQVRTRQQAERLPDNTIMFVYLLGGVWLFRWDGNDLVDSDNGRIVPVDWLVEHYGKLTVLWRPW